MKKIFTLSLLLTLSLWSFSQSLEVVKDSVELTFDSTFELYLGKTYLKNTTSDSVQVVWSARDQSYPREWTSSFCFEGLCINIDRIGRDTMFWLGPNDSTEIKGQVEDGGLGAGIGEFVIEFEDMNNRGVKVGTHYSLDLGPVSVKEVSSLNVDVFPNPMNDRLTINGLNDFHGTVELYDVLGKRVNQQQVKGQSGVVLNTQSLKPGIYILRLFDAAAQEVYAMPVQRTGR